MSDINVTTLSGRLTRDGEFLGEAKKAFKFSIAVNRFVPKKDSDGKEFDKKTLFMDVITFNSLDFYAKQAKKWKKVTVTGTLDMSEWTDKEGNKRTAYNLLANNVVFATIEKEEGGATTGTATGSDLPF